MAITTSFMAGSKGEKYMQILSVNTRNSGVAIFYQYHASNIAEKIGKVKGDNLSDKVRRALQLLTADNLLAAVFSDDVMTSIDNQNLKTKETEEE